MAATKTQTYHVQVIDRVLGMLDVLASNGPAVTLAELSKQLGLPKSTVLRLLTVLERHRLVAKSGRNGGYRLGLKLFELGSRAVEQLDFGEHARPHLERLALITGETAYLCILDGSEVLSLDKVESSQMVRVPASVGRRNPAYCTALGKVLLAFLPDTELHNLFKKKKLKVYTPNTLTTLGQLKAEFQRVRECGYAIDNEEMEEGLRCIGAPIRGHSGQVVASLGILGPAFRLTEQTVPQSAAAVVAIAHNLSAELGYHAEPDVSQRANV